MVVAPTTRILGPGGTVHELALMEGMLLAIEESAQAQGFQRVRGVVLEVGCFAGVDPEALRFAFEVVTGGTVAEGACLTLEEPLGTGWCAACNQGLPVRSRLDPCPLCEGFPLRVTGGTELRLKALDVD